MTGGCKGMEEGEMQARLQEVRSAIKALCFLYPRAGGCDEPKCDGGVIRRLQLRERDGIESLLSREKR